MIVIILIRFQENQYFISSIKKPVPKNKILKALYERLHSAIENNETFRVIVVLPNYPAGNIEDGTRNSLKILTIFFTTAATRYVIDHVYNSVNREGSILQQLKKDFPGVDISNYIYFFALRTYGYIGDRPVSGTFDRLIRINFNWLLILFRKLYSVTIFHVLMNLSRTNIRSFKIDDCGRQNFHNRKCEHK